MRTFILRSGLVAMVALAGCGGGDKPAATAAAGGAAAATDEITYKCPCGETKKAKKGDKAPECCGKPMLAS